MKYLLLTIILWFAFLWIRGQQYTFPQFGNIWPSLTQLEEQMSRESGTRGR